MNSTDMLSSTAMQFPFPVVTTASSKLPAVISSEVGVYVMLAEVFVGLKLPLPDHKIPDPTVKLTEA